MIQLISGIVSNGVVIPASPLPEGARVEVSVKLEAPIAPAPKTSLTASELLKLPREQRLAILAANASEAEELYRNDKELTGFDAFSEELDDDADEG